MGIRCLLRSIISAIMIGFLFLLTISPKESSALDVQIDTEKRTWRNANFWCQLLGSNESGLFFELSDTFTNHVPEDGREYWIAAIKKTTAPFKFDRCISITNERKTYLHKTNQPVYDCYNFCNGSRFALSSRQCVCIDFLQTKVTISRCYNTLFNNTQMDFYSEKVFLELQTGQFRSQANGTGDCAAVILVPGKNVGLHEFLPCSTKLPCVCQGEKEKSVYLQPERRNWTNSVLNCDGVLRGSFDGIYILSNPPSSITRAWTGISRRSIKQWNTGNVTDPSECLAVSKNRSVNVQAKNCSDMLPSLCQQEEVLREKITQGVNLTTYSGTTPEEATQQEIGRPVDYNQRRADANGFTIVAIGSTLVIISGLFFLASVIIFLKARNLTKCAENAMIRSTYDSVNINALAASNYSSLESSTTSKAHLSPNQENDGYMVPSSYK